MSCRRDRAAVRSSLVPQGCWSSAGVPDGPGGCQAVQWLQELPAIAVPRYMCGKLAETMWVIGVCADGTATEKGSVPFSPGLSPPRKRGSISGSGAVALIPACAGMTFERIRRGSSLFYRLILAPVVSVPFLTIAGVSLSW